MVANNRQIIVVVLLILSLGSLNGGLRAQDFSSQATSWTFEPDNPGDPWPWWMLNPPEFLHGFGVAKFSRYDTARSYLEARYMAIQDLNANALMVATIELGMSNRFPLVTFEEFAISDKFDNSNVYAIDSAIVGRRVFYLVADQPRTIEALALQTVPEVSNLKEELNPYFEDPYWFFPGSYKIFKYNKQKSWIKAQQKAISEFVKYQASDIASRQTLYEQGGYDKLRQITYMKSRLAMKNLSVHERWSDGENYYVLFRIKESDIIFINDK